MKELEKGTFRLVQDPREPIKLVCSETGVQVLACINDDVRSDDLCLLVPETSMSGRVFLRKVVSPQDQPEAFYLVPKMAQVPTLSVTGVMVLPTDAPDALILDSRSVGSEYLVLKIDGADVEGAENSDVAIMAVHLSTGNVSIFTEIEDYDVWLTRCKRDFLEQRSSVDVGTTSSGIPVPVFFREQGRYGFPDGSFVKLQDVLENPPLFPPELFDEQQQ